VITQHLKESAWAQVQLPAEAADKLRELGRRLASDSTWWGAGADSDLVADATIIRCEHNSGDTYRVRVSDAVGVIGLGANQLLVEPKIPIDHLAFLLGQASQVPRLADRPAQLETADGFFDLIARWFMLSTERLLRRDLLRDYALETDEIGAVRGRVHLVPTTRALLTGRCRLRCEFEEFSLDTPLNRVLNAAASIVAGSTALGPDLRARAHRIVARFDHVSDLMPYDVRTQPDSRSAYYAEAITLAKCIISGTGRTLRPGTRLSSTFLFRTPDVVEEGIRRVLASGLSAQCRVHKSGLVLDGSRRRSLNPDLVFGASEAVGDVKYALFDGEFKRPYLNQLVTFAAGYSCQKGLLVCFGDKAKSEHVVVGGIRLDTMNWNVQQVTPQLAASELCQRVADWLAQ